MIFACQPFTLGIPFCIIPSAQLEDLGMATWHSESTRRPFLWHLSDQIVHIILTILGHLQMGSWMMTGVWKITGHWPLNMNLTGAPYMMLWSHPKIRQQIKFGNCYNLTRSFPMTGDPFLQACQPCGFFQPHNYGFPPSKYPKWHMFRGIFWDVSLLSTAIKFLVKKHTMRRCPDDLDDILVESPPTACLGFSTRHPTSCPWPVSSHQPAPHRLMGMFTEYWQVKFYPLVIKHGNGKSPFYTWCSHSNAYL